jgi:hypothetical protein
VCSIEASPMRCQRRRPEHWTGTPQLSFGTAELLRLHSTWTNRDPSAAARMSVRLTVSAFHSQFGSVYPCCSPNESVACFIHAADSSAVQKILPWSEKCETLCQFCLPVWDISASEWDLQGHRLHLSSQCSDRQIICHTIATAIASSFLATYVSDVSELWRSEQICYRSD